MTDSSLPADGVANAVVLRPLTISEAADAAAVIRAAFSAQSGPTHPPSSALRETAESVSAKIAAGGGIGAVHYGRLVALLIWQVEGDALYIGRVSVLPAFRGRGLTRPLIGAAEAATRARGLRRMRLRVRLALPENERLFERYGFARCGLDTHEGFDAPTVAVMEKRLP